MSRTKTPTIGKFFGNDEDYFEYSPIKSKTKSPIWSSISRKEIDKMFGSKTRTKTPSIGNFFGDDENYFEYSPIKSKSKSPIITRALGGGGGGGSINRDENSRQSMSSAKSSRSFERKIVSLQKERDDLGIQDLLQGYKATYTDEESRKTLKTKLSTNNQLLTILLQSVLSNKTEQIYILPSELDFTVLLDFTGAVNFTQRQITLWDYENLLLNISSNSKLFVKYLNTCISNISSIKRIQFDIEEFRESDRRYLIIPIGLKLNHYDGERSKSLSSHATIFIYDTVERKGFYIDPQYTSQFTSMYVEVENKIKYYIQLFLYEDIENLINLSNLYEEFIKIQDEIKETTSLSKIENDKLKEKLNSKGMEIKKIETKIKDSSLDLDIGTIKTICPQTIVKDRNCMFWSIFLIDIMIRNLDPSSYNINPQAIIDRIVELYGDDPRKLETIILRYVKYLNSFELKEEYE